jgi:hypothetical protein
LSVGTRRLAAAQRTAASTNPSTARRLGAWIIIVPALSLFSFSIVASAAGFRSSPDLASSAAKVVPEKHDEERKSGGSNGSGENKQNGELVLVDASHGGDGGIASLLGRGDRQICWISNSQLVRVSAVYRTSTSTVRVGHRTYGLATVFGANERDLRSLLGAPAVQCKLVHAERRFFLPFDPNLS